MSTSTNTISIPKTSTEIKKLALAPSTSYYVTQTDLGDSLNAFLKILESMNTLIAKQYVKVEDKPKYRYSPCHSPLNIYLLNITLRANFRPIFLHTIKLLKNKKNH